MRRALFPFVFLLMATYFSHAQQGELIENKALHFSINDHNEIIDFVVVDTVINQKKPVLLFCQGSLPNPLFFELRDGGIFFFGGGISNFDLKYIRKQYHLVVISMPTVPIFAETKDLNDQYCYVPAELENRNINPTFARENYLEKYVSRAQKVIRFLWKQSWVSHDKLVVFGHSQGTKIATRLAAENKKITHLGLFAPNPFGRIDQFIRDQRTMAESGQISWQEADQNMNDYYQEYESSFNPDSIKSNPYYREINSFSEPLLPYWLKLEIPVFMVYATGDSVSDLMDIMPLFFIQNRKKNISFHRRLNENHNFFEVDENGSPNYEKGHWPEVVNDFVDWTLTTQ